MGERADSNAGRYSRRIEILRETISRTSIGGVRKDWVLLKKAWGKHPDSSGLSSSRSQASGRDGGRVRLQFAVLRESAAGITTSDRIRDKGRDYVIYSIVQTSETEIVLSGESVE